MEDINLRKKLKFLFLCGHWYYINVDMPKLPLNGITIENNKIIAIYKKYLLVTHDYIGSNSEIY